MLPFPRSVLFNNLTIQGGMGADSITNSGIGVAAGTGVFQYSRIPNPH